jgi:hypothetical protein
MNAPAESLAFQYPTPSWRQHGQLPALGASAVRGYTDRAKTVFEGGAQPICPELIPMCAWRTDTKMDCRIDPPSYADTSMTVSGREEGAILQMAMLERRSQY